MKPERIKLNPFRYNGFIYNGNLLILQPDHVVLKNMNLGLIEEDAKIKSVNAE
jgi:hypothetical protein